MSGEVQQEVQHFVFNDNLRDKGGGRGWFSKSVIITDSALTHILKQIASVYLVSTLELLLVKIKVSTESSHSKQ